MLSESEDSLEDTISKAKDSLSKFYRQDSSETIDKTSKIIDKIDSQSIDKISKNIQIRYRKCGKANCHCRNSKGHGPYRYRLIYDKESKKQHWVYLGRA
ncbi:MAG: DUF6788 family protein [Candidatus Hodarchaeota archaeon]